MRRRSHYEHSMRGIFATSIRVKDLLGTHVTGLSSEQIADALRISLGAASSALVKLKKDGAVVSVGLASWRLKPREVIAPPPCVVDSFIRPPSLARLMGSR